MAPLTGPGFTRLGDQLSGALGAFALRLHFVGMSMSLR
jgi:hypothetical protein